MVRLILTLLCVLGVMPLCSGLLFAGLSGREDDSPLYVYLSGLLLLLGVFQVLAVPMSYLNKSLKLLCLVFLSAGAVLSLAGVAVVCIRHRLGTLARWSRNSLRRFTPVLAAAAACILLQLAFVTVRQHIDEDDAFYLGTAVTAVQTDSLYRVDPYTGRSYSTHEQVRYMLSSWPLFLAMLSKVSGVHAVRLAHMAMPAIVLLWCYLVYFLLAGWLYPDRPDKGARFLFFIVILHTFAGYSIYNAQIFSVIRGWQGKAVLCGMGLPALTYFCLRTMQEPEEPGAREAGSGRGAAGRGDRWSLEWTALTAAVAAMTCFTSIGSIFAVIITGSFALYHAVRARSVRYLVNCIPACAPALVCCAVYLLKRG